MLLEVAREAARGAEDSSLTWGVLLAREEQQRAALDQQTRRLGGVSRKKLRRAGSR